MPRQEYGIIIVGGGILGAATAYYLAKLGADTLLLESGKIGEGITGRSFGWLNAYNAENRDYYDFRRKSMREYTILASELGGRGPKWGGSLVWSYEKAEAKTLVNRLQSWDYDIEIIGSEKIAELEPGLTIVPDEACYSGVEGCVEPQEITRKLIGAGVRNGLHVQDNCAVTGISTSDRRVTGVQTEDTVFNCRDLVIAAGHGCMPLCDSVGVSVPVKTSESLLVRTLPLPPVIRCLIAAPGVRMWQDEKGRILACDDFGGRDLSSRNEVLSEQLLERVSGLLSLPTRARSEQIMTGHRLVPRDGLPVIGRAGNIDGLYLVMMHSGITLAPLAGRLIAQELAYDREEEILRPYRPDRPALA